MRYRALWTPVAILLPMLLLGCSADQTTTQPVPPSPSPSSSPVFSRVDAFEPLVRKLIRGDDVPRGELVVVSSICGYMPGDHGRKTCAEPLSDEERQELASRLANVSSDIGFVDTFDAAWDEGGQVVWLGPLRETHGGLRSVAGTICGGLCGWGGTFELELRHGTWVVVGNAPDTPQWIA